jgi:hypothetical protein
MGEDLGFGGGEIGCVVGAETELGSRGGLCSERVKEVGLHEPMFVVATFGPRIREEYKYALENDMRWQRGDEFSGFSLEENEIGELGAIAFALGTFDAVAEQIEADAKFLGMRGGVISQKMSVTSSNLERDARVRGEQFRQLLLERGAAGVAVGDELCGAGGIVHMAG